MKKYLIGAAGLALGLAPVVAHAGPIVAGKCDSVASPAGCLFEGNINNNPDPMNANSYKNAEALYNQLNLPDITLNYLFDTDTTGGLITGGGTASGTWALPAGYLVDFIAVKAANYFVLYQVDPSAPHNWDTFDIPYKNNPHDLSHLVFFGSQANAVPEPAAWGMLIGGFALAGAAIRRRKVAVRFAV